MFVCVFMLSIAIKNLLYFLYHGSREHTKFKSTNFYRIIKSSFLFQLESDAYTTKTNDANEGNARMGREATTLKQHFSTFSIFISFPSNGSARKKVYKKYQIYGVYNFIFMPSLAAALSLLSGS